jgi:protein-L-isoaspartate(D-aspartate) O-methyltransferase
MRVLVALVVVGTALAEPETRPSWSPPVPTASAERVEERESMVKTQIAHSPDGRTRVGDENVLKAMRAVPRHIFVPKARRGQAYRDSPLPIGHGQTISQPYIVAMMTELLELDQNTRVLEIGTGSGYQAAVLAQMTPHVYTVEIVEPLAERARRTLAAQGYDSVRTRHADGYLGWPEHAPFDVIIVTCAAGHVPLPLWEQLAPGGRIVIPIGGPYEVQRLIVLTKQTDGTRRTRTVMNVRFVPMTGKARR